MELRQTIDIPFALECLYEEVNYKDFYGRSSVPLWSIREGVRAIRIKAIDSKAKKGKKNVLII